MTRPSAAVPIVVGVALLLSMLVAFAALLATVSAEEAAAAQPDAAEGAAKKPEAEAAPAEELPDDATLLKMKVRELKAFLAKKGPDAECVACTSKLEYVDRIRETESWPVVDPPKEDDSPSKEELEKLFQGGRDPKQMEELKKRLQDAGIDTSNIFTGDDFDSEAFAKQFKKWESADGAKAGAGADAGANDESHVDL